MTKTLKAILVVGCTSIALSYGADDTVVKWRHNPYSAEGYTIISGNAEFNPFSLGTKEEAPRSGSGAADTEYGASREGVSPVSGDGEMYPHYAQYSVDYDPNCPYVNGMTAVSNSTALPSYAEWRRAQSGSPLAEGYSSGSSDDASPKAVPLPSYMKGKK